MTADFIRNALGPGALGPFPLPDTAGAPTGPGVVILMERRENHARPLGVRETLDIAATLAAEPPGAARYAYALAFSHQTDPTGVWRRSVADTVCERLRDAGWDDASVGHTPGHRIGDDRRCLRPWVRFE